MYSITMTGSFIDNKLDFPLLMIIVQEAINHRLDGPKAFPDCVEIGLDKVLPLLNHKAVRKSSASFNPIENSLNRLSSANLKIIINANKSKYREESKLCDGQLINKFVGQDLWIDFKAKTFTVAITENLQRLYPMSKIKRSITYFDLEQFFTVNNGLARSIFKYYASQGRDFIDISTDSLYAITSIDKLSSSTNKKRERIKVALDDLEQNKFLSKWKFYKKENRYRCLRSDFDYDDDKIDQLKSNITEYSDRFKSPERKLADRRRKMAEHNRGVTAAKQTEIDKTDELEPNQIRHDNNPDEFPDLDFSDDLPF